MTAISSISGFEGATLYPVYRVFRPSPFGDVAVIWSQQRGAPRISRIFLARPRLSAKHAVRESFPGAIAGTCTTIDRVADMIDSFLRGESIRFSLNMMRLDLCSAFQQQVLRAEHAIPRGSVSTYQRIAHYLGSPRGARAVGRALATNPFPIIIPCHRAIRSDLTLGGFQGGLRMKRALLEMEGIGFDESGRAVKENLHYWPG